MNVTSNHLSSFAIGRFFPIAVLGYYYQAHRLYTSNSELLVAVIDRVAFPVLCKSPDKEEMVRSSHNIFKPVFTLLYPAFAVGIVIAEKFVILVLGEQWQTAGQYFAILLIALFPGLVKVMLRNVLKSAGNTRAIFLTEMLTAIIMLTLICVAIRISILALVGSFAVGMFCSMLIYAKFSYADKMVNFRDIGKITFVPLCAAVIAGVTTWGTLLLCGDYFYSVVSLGIVFVAASFVFYLAVGNVYCLQILNYGKRAFFSKFCKS